MITENIYDIQHVSSWEDIKKLIKDNNKYLEYLNQYEGLDHFLGSGQYGKVFKIKGKDLTIKVTTDRDEIRESNILRRAGQTNNFINIYEMQIIKPNLAIKVQDLLYPLSGANKRKAVLYDIADDISKGSKRNYTLNHLVERVKIYNEENFNYEFIDVKIRE